MRDSASTTDSQLLKVRIYPCLRLGVGIMCISDDCCHKRLVHSFRIDKYFSAGVQVCYHGNLWEDNSN